MKLRTCDHQVPFCPAEDLYIQQPLRPCLCERGFEEAVEGILDVSFVQAPFFVEFCGWRRGHGGRSGETALCGAAREYFMLCSVREWSLHPGREMNNPCVEPAQRSAGSAARAIIGQLGCRAINCQY
jgi:hypothetical protein